MACGRGSKFDLLSRLNVGRLVKAQCWTSSPGTRSRCDATSDSLTGLSPRFAVLETCLGRGLP